MGRIIPYIMEITNVPNHQSGEVWWFQTSCFRGRWSNEAKLAHSGSEKWACMANGHALFASSSMKMVPTKNPIYSGWLPIGAAAKTRVPTRKQCLFQETSTVWLKHEQEFIVIWSFPQKKTVSAFHSESGKRKAQRTFLMAAAHVCG